MIAELSTRLRMPCISMEEMRDSEAAFDLVPYSEAARRACVALRDGDGAVSVVLGDPFDRTATLLALAQAPGLESDRGQGRHERKFATTAIVVALAQHSAAPASPEDSNVKEVRIERRAPRYFTDYRGAIFHM